MNRKMFQEFCQVFLRLHQQHRKILQSLLTPEPFLAGSIVIFRRKCGQSACRCQRGFLHESVTISQGVGRKRKVIYTRKEDQRQIMEYRHHYQKFRKGKKELLNLQKKIGEKLDRFVKFKTEPYRPSS